MANGDVWSFEISPIGDRVVYRGDVQTNDKVELYSVPISGGISIKLSHPTMLSTGEIKSFEINEQGTRVAYLVDEVQNFALDLWAAPITGGGATKLNQRRGTGDSVLELKISPLGDRVVFRYYDWNPTQGVDNVEIYSAPLVGGSLVRLNETLEASGDIDHFEFTPDGDWVLYQGDPSVALDSLIMRAPAAGPANDELVSLVDGPPRSVADRRRARPGRRWRTGPLPRHDHPTLAAPPVDT